MKNLCLKFCYFSLFSLILLTLVSCSYAESVKNTKNLQKLRTGMTKEQVISIMGKPLENERYNTPNFWFYYTTPQWYDGVYTRDECTPIVFDDYGVLQGVGYEYYKKVLNSDEWSRQQIDNQL